MRRFLALAPLPVLLVLLLPVGARATAGHTLAAETCEVTDESAGPNDAGTKTVTVNVYLQFPFGEANKKVDWVANITDIDGGEPVPDIHKDGEQNTQQNGAISIEPMVTLQLTPGCHTITVEASGTFPGPPERDYSGSKTKKFFVHKDGTANIYVDMKKDE